MWRNILRSVSGELVILTKRDAANRQLNEAIPLLFCGGDTVAIHTLVGASSLILSDLIQHKSPENSWDKYAQEANKLDSKSFYAAMRKTQNYLKHAKSDPEETFEFDEFEQLPQIIFAIMNNCELGGIIPLEQSFFQLWYFSSFHKEIGFEGNTGELSKEMFGDLSCYSDVDRLKIGSQKWKEFITHNQS